MQRIKQALVANGFGMPANIQELKLYSHEKHLSIELFNHSDNQNVKANTQYKG
ncbi:hypothetical protein Q0590_30720 [Rhodocytophaga aerolata]|uniref:Uncharacterized protein n=1 Tax=Rhodocytophaga aerolata TaxID=455078 RepID=A0ABT8RJ11_9BACT|nr:hypothetical protein [Rhodocytophaga aerolata]MDO1450687.1 hypothetical protein [Rhodocytophaga aerolata]